MRRCEVCKSGLLNVPGTHHTYLCWKCGIRVRYQHQWMKDFVAPLAFALFCVALAATLFTGPWF